MKRRIPIVVFGVDCGIAYDWVHEKFLDDLDGVSYVGLTFTLPQDSQM
jgi:hypothetical protein